MVVPALSLRFSAHRLVPILAALAAWAALPVLWSGNAAYANDGLDRWGGVVLFCAYPIPTQPWGDEACSLVEEEAAKQASSLGVPIVSVPAAQAGLAGGPQDQAPPFDWGKALRLLVKFDRTQSASYPWSMTLMFYDHPADAAGERAEGRYQILFQQSATLLDGQELQGVRDVGPPLLGGSLEQFFKPQ